MLIYSLIMSTIEENNKLYLIPLPKRESEFELQSMMFSILKSQGFIVRGEVKAYKSRLDLVVYGRDNKAKCIIEVKARARLRKTYRKYKQVTKYETLFKLPVVVCHNRTKVGESLDKVREIMNA